MKVQPLTVRCCGMNFSETRPIAEVTMSTVKNPPMHFPTSSANSHTVCSLLIWLYHGYCCIYIFMSEERQPESGHIPIIHDHFKLFLYIPLKPDPLYPYIEGSVFPLTQCYVALRTIWNLVMFPNPFPGRAEIECQSIFEWLWAVYLWRHILLNHFVKIR